MIRNVIRSVTEKLQASLHEFNTSTTKSIDELMAQTAATEEKGARLQKEKERLSNEKVRFYNSSDFLIFKLATNRSRYRRLEQAIRRFRPMARTERYYETSRYRCNYRSKRHISKTVCGVPFSRN